MKKGQKLKYKIKGVKKGFENLIFGAQIESLKKIKEFIKEAEVTTVKNKSSVITDVIKSMHMKEYYVKYGGNEDYFDDVVDVYYIK